jgi:proteic killer suppression protein
VHAFRLFGVAAVLGACSETLLSGVTPLVLAFAQKDLRRLCESEVAAQRMLGSKVAAGLERRLADLEAATHVRELIAGAPRELDGACRGQIAVELGDGHVMVLSANHQPMPSLASGGVDWSRVNRVKILRIEKS